MTSDPSYYFICNPASNTGRSKKNWPKLLQVIEEKIPKDQFSWVFTDYPTHGTEIAEEAIDEGYKSLISVGGDGIANEVVNGIMHKQKNTPFGMIPMGSSNDLHLNYGLSKDPVNALEIILKGNSHQFGLGEITGDFSDEPHYFVDHVDCGLASLGAKGARDGVRWIKGEFKYTYYAFKEVLKFNRNYAHVIVDGEEQEGEYTLISAAAGDVMGGYLVWPGNHHWHDDFAFCIAKGQSRWQLLKLMIAAEKGKHIEHKGVQLLRGKRLEISLERPWPFQSEGEIFTEGSKEIQITYKPQMLNLYVDGVYKGKKPNS